MTEFAKLASIASTEEARVWIRAALDDYLDGGADVENESLDLGRKWELDGDVIKQAWNNARKMRAAFVVPLTQPPLVGSKPAQPRATVGPKAKLDKVIEAEEAERQKPLKAKAPVEVDDFAWQEEPKEEAPATHLEAMLGLAAKPDAAKAKPKPEEEEPPLEEPEPELSEPVEPKFDRVPDHIMASLRKLSPEEITREAEPEPAKPSTALIVRPCFEMAETLSADEPEVYLAAMNERHAIIDNVGGKTVIASWEISPLDTSKQKIEYGTKESLLLRYSNYRVWSEVGNDFKKVPLAPWWLGHPERRQYRGILFRPGEPKVIDRCLNMWQGWGVEAKQGDWSLIRRHIEKVLANGDQEYAIYIIRWIAWSIQHPGKQAEVALVLIGKKGTGKGTLGRCLRRIFGAHAFQVTSREEVIGKFNGHLQDCILFIADEAYWGGDKRCVGRLQGMITEETIPVERKGIDMIQVMNCLHMLMFAEPGWVIPAGKHERRYAASYVSQAMLGNKPYFKALHDQIDGDGASAMLYDLQRMDLGDWHPRDIEKMKKSPALLDQQIKSLPPLEQWYFMILQDGVIPGAFPKRPNTAYTHALVDDAKGRIPRLRYELTDPMLRNFLTDRDSLGIDVKKFRNSAGNGWSFPPLDECRAAWDRNYNPIAWDPDIVEWKTRQKESLNERS